MSIKLTYNDMANPNFQQVVRRLQYMQLPTQVAYQLKKILEGIDKQRAVISSQFETEVLPKFVGKDDKGEFLKNAEGQIDIPETKKDEFLKAQADFGTRTFSIERSKLRLSDLGSVQLSTVELIALNALIEDPEAVQDPSNVVPLSG